MVDRAAFSSAAVLMGMVSSKLLGRMPVLLILRQYNIFHCQYILFLKVSCRIAAISCREAYLRNIYHISAIIGIIGVNTGFMLLFTGFSDIFE